MPLPAGTRLGPYEIFLQPFLGPGDPIPVSVGGGRQAKWRADGRELFCLAPDGGDVRLKLRPGDRSLAARRAKPQGV